MQEDTIRYNKSFERCTHILSRHICISYQPFLLQKVWCHHVQPLTASWHCWQRNSGDSALADMWHLKWWLQVSRSDLFRPFCFFNKRTQESHGPKGFLRFWSLGELFTEGLKFNLPLIPINAWEDGGLWGWMDLWSTDMASISKFRQVAGWPQGKLWRATSSHAWPGLFALLGSAHFASCCTWTQGRQLFQRNLIGKLELAARWWLIQYIHSYNIQPWCTATAQRVRGLAVGPCSFAQSRCWWHVLSRCLWADSIAPCSTGQTTDSPGGMADDGSGMADDVHVFARICFMLAMRVGGIPFGLVWHDVSWRRMSLR